MHSSRKKSREWGISRPFQLPQTRLVWRPFGKVCEISATVRDRTLSLSTVMRVAGSSGFPSLWPSWLGHKPDVLVAVTTNAAQAAKKATTTIPIVFMGVTDPVTAGLVDSLAWPGGNITGITNMAAILTGKRLELFKRTLPTVSRVAVLWDPQRSWLRAPVASQSTAGAGTRSAPVFDGGQQCRSI